MSGFGRDSFKTIVATVIERVGSPNQLTITQGGAGNLYMTGANNDCVPVFDCKGQFLSTFGRKNTASNFVPRPVACDLGTRYQAIST